MPAALLFCRSGHGTPAVNPAPVIITVVQPQPGYPPRLAAPGKRTGTTNRPERSGVVQHRAGKSVNRTAGTAVRQNAATGQPKQRRCLPGHAAHLNVQTAGALCIFPATAATGTALARTAERLYAAQPE